MKQSARDARPDAGVVRLSSRDRCDLSRLRGEGPAMPARNETLHKEHHPMSKKTSRADLLAADQNLIDGITKNASKLPASFPVGSVTTTPAEVVTLLQGRVTTGKAVILAESARTAAVQTDRTTRAQSQPRLIAFKRIIIAMFLQSPDVLGDFGLAAPKPPVKSAAVKAKAAAKGTATRKAKVAPAPAPAPEPVAPAVAPAPT